MNPLVAKYLLYYPCQLLRREPVVSALRELEDSQWSSRKDLVEASFDRMLQLLHYAYRYVPLYRRKMDDLRARPEDIKSLDAWNQLPLLTKEEVQEHSEELLSTKAARVGLIKKTTSGSTGQVVTVYKSPSAAGYARAAMYRGYRWWGLDIGSKQARFWGVPINLGTRFKYRWIDLLMNRKRISAFNFSERSMSRYYEVLLKFRPDYLYGYVSMIGQFASFLNDHGLDGRAIGSKLVVTTAEVLPESQRCLLERTFGCKVQNEYGCGEVGPIAYECPAGGFHINAENLFLEFMKPAGNGISDHDDLREIVVTELRNLPMPLIRYRLGDYARQVETPCECGRGLPLLKEIVGRAYDFIISPDGRRFHGEYIMYLFEELKARGWGINQFQVVQLKSDSLTIKIVRGSNYHDAAHQYLEQQLKQTLGADMNVAFDFVPEIPRERSGKIRLIRSHVY